MIQFRYGGTFRLTRSTNGNQFKEKEVMVSGTMETLNLS
jgi:hypothetical protein